MQFAGKTLTRLISLSWQAPEGVSGDLLHRATREETRVADRDRQDRADQVCLAKMDYCVVLLQAGFRSPGLPFACASAFVGIVQ